MAATPSKSSAANGTPAGRAPTDPPRRRAARPTPVLVPQDALVGQPDVPLNRAVTVVGSADTCRLVLQSRTISRHHAVFLVDAGRTVLADLASRTGVLVNGKTVHEAELKSGDRVQVGKFSFRYRSADVPPAADAPPPAPAAAAVVTGLLSIPLPGRLALVGRRETSDVALIGDPAVSAAHAALFHAGGQWYVRDLGSRTGTTVNGSPVVQQAIAFGDRIGVGAATILFEPAAAVAGHATVAGLSLSDSLALPAPAPLPERKPDPIPLAPEVDVRIPLPPDIDDPADPPNLAADVAIDATPLPAVPFGLVTADATPADAGLTVTGPADVSPAESPVAAFAAELAVPGGPPHRPPPRPIPFADRDPALPHEVEPVTPAAHRPPPTPLPVADGVADSPPVVSYMAEPEPVVTPESLGEPAAAGLAAVLPEFVPTPAAVSAEPPLAPAAHEPFAAVVSDSVVVPTDESDLPAADPSAALAPPEAVLDAVPAGQAFAADLSAAPTAESEDPPPADAADDFGAEAAAPLPPGGSDVAAVGLEPVPAVGPPATAEAMPDPWDADAVADRVPDVAAVPDVVAAPVASIPPAADLWADVSDFVFVPGEAAAAAVPDVLFWGDDDLDAATEAAAFVPAPVPTAAAAKRADPLPSPPAEPEPAASTAGPAVIDVTSDAAAMPAAAALDPLPSAEPEAAASPLDEWADASSDGPAVIDAASDNGAAPATALDASLPADPAAVGGAEPAESAAAAIDAVGPTGAEPFPPEPLETAEAVEFGAVLDAAGLADAEPFSPPADAAVVVDLDSELDAAFAAGGAAEAVEVDGPDGPSPLTFEPTDLAAVDPFDAAAPQPIETGPEADARVAPADSSDVGDVPARPLAAEGLDPALAVTPDEGDSAVDPVAFDDLLDEAPPPSAAEPLAITFDQTDDGLGTAVVAVDEPAGFDLDPADEVAEADAGADWADLDLLPAGDDAGAVVNVDEVPISTTASAPEKALPSLAGDATADGSDPAVPAVAAVDQPAVASQDDAPPSDQLLASLDDDAAVPADGFADDAEIGAAAVTEEPLPATADGHDPAAVAAEVGATTVTGAAAGAAGAVVNVDGEPSVLDPAPSAAAAEPPRMSGPSLFGFSFEGGSFLGGMSLPLSVPPGEVPPAGITFDAPVAEVPGAPAAVAAEAVDLAATVNVPPPAFGQTATSGDLAAEAARVRPATPPRPLGLTGLVTGTAGGGGDAEGSAPVLPVGLTGPGGGRVPPPPVPPAGGFAAPALGRPRTADVFSQMAGPIGVVEAFGGRPGRTEPPVIPEVDRSAPPAAVAPVGPASATPQAYANRPPPQRLPDARRLIPPPLPRRTRVRALIAACVAGPVLWGVGVYTSMSKTATVAGTLHYAGLAELQSEAAKRRFHVEQVSTLCGDDVRALARGTLVAAGKPTGPTEDAGSLGMALQDEKMRFDWGPSDLRVVYQAPDADAGRAQVAALLSILRAKDEALTTARATAVADLDAARGVTAAAKANLDALQVQWKQQLGLAQDRPDKATLDAQDQAADDATRHAAAVRADRASTEASLAAWRQQDPAVPVDAATDPELAGLRRQLGANQAQLDKAKQLSALRGDATPAAGTDDDDPLQAQLRDRAKQLSAQIDRRAADLARTAAVPVAERARQRDRAIDLLGVKLTGLRAEEASTGAAAAMATAAATDGHAKTDAAHLADAKAADLRNQTADAEVRFKEANNDQDPKQAAVDTAVTVDGSTATNPDVSVPTQSDPRPLVAAVGAGVIFAALFLWLLRTAGTGDAGRGYDDGPGYEEADEAAVDAREPVGV